MPKFKATAYIRLSYTDDHSSESDSVSNQRKLIENFVEHNPDIEVVSEKIDDGYSGIIFDRPAFKEMMQDVTDGNINCVIVKDLSRLVLTIADEHGGKLPNRVMMFADEIGTIPKIESMEMMFSAGRSRRISMVPIIQSFAQLEKNYGKEGSSIIIDNCQDILFGGFAPNSESAEILSKALGNRTVLSGSISRGKNDPSQSLQMMSHGSKHPHLPPHRRSSLHLGLPEWFRPARILGFG